MTDSGKPRSSEWTPGRKGYMTRKRNANARFMEALRDGRREAGYWRFYCVYCGRPSNLGNSLVCTRAKAILERGTPVCLSRTCDSSRPAS